MAKEGVTKFNWSRDKNIPRIEDTLLATLVEEPTKCRAELKEDKLMGEDENGVGFGNIAIEIPPEFRNGRRGGLEFLVTESQSSGLEVLSPDNWVHVTKCFPERNSVLVAGKSGSGKTGNGPSSEAMSLEAVLASASGAGAVIHVHSATMWNMIMKSKETKYQNRLVAGVGYQLVGGWTERITPPKVLNKPFYKMVDFSGRVIYGIIRMSGKMAYGLSKKVISQFMIMPYEIPVTSEAAAYGTPELAKSVREEIGAAILRKRNRGLLQKLCEYIGNKLLGRNAPDYETFGMIAMGGHENGLLAYAPTAEAAKQMIFDCKKKAGRLLSIESLIRPTQPAF